MAHLMSGGYKRDTYFLASSNNGCGMCRRLKEILCHLKTMSVACVGMWCLEPTRDTLAHEIIDFGMCRHALKRFWQGAKGRGSSDIWSLTEILWHSKTMSYACVGIAKRS